MPRFVQRLYPERLWAFSSSDSIYLTFDDGPIPEVTPWVLDQLRKHNARATFFCIGENIQKHPGLFKQVLSEGHAIGNHTYNHLNGWKTNTLQYIENVIKCESLIDAISTSQGVRIFRPPYGKITPNQARILRKKGYKIVMWNIISYDYDAMVSPKECLQNVLKKISPGSVIVFHDSLKAEKNLRHTLPKVLEYSAKKNWKFLPITQ